jgi:hypothetical protein
MAAIYMWRVDEQTLLTTTLYPVEALDGVMMSTSFANGSMTTIPFESATIAAGELIGSYTQTRWFYTKDFGLEEATIAAGELIGTYTQTRWFYTHDTGIDETTIAAGNLTGSYSLTRIFADSPDEGLEFSTAIEPSGCSMTLE